MRSQLAGKEQKFIHQLLEHSARCWPDKIALVHGEDRVNYRLINTEANRLARWISANGVFAGDRVVLLLENCREYVVAYYGILKAGAVAVPLNSEMKKEGLSPLLAELEPKAIIASEKVEGVLRDLPLRDFGLQALALRSPRHSWQGQGLRVASLRDLLSAGESADPDLSLDEEQMSSIIYTSGSTGKPKGAMLSHSNIMSNVRSIVSYLGLTSDDIQMVVLPFFYVMGKSLLNTHIAVGGSLVLNNKFAFPAAIVHQMSEEKVTGFSGVPATFAHLLHRSPLAAYRGRLEALRYCSQAGGHMDRTTKKALIDALPRHTKFFVMYGATEASARLSFVEPARLIEKIDSVGRAIPGVTLKVLDEKGKEIPIGEVGEIVASGPNIMQGYWRDPASTAAALSPHGYHTGDLGFRDADGYFYITGRKDNQLKVGGHRINPKEVEDLLMASGLLVEVAVVGAVDALLGHRLVALATPQGVNLNVQDLLKGCAARVPGYKVPTEVLLVRALPKNDNGKVDRSACESIVRGSTGEHDSYRKLKNDE